jgi:hypothetical protein
MPFLLLDTAVGAKQQSLLPGTLQVFAEVAGAGVTRASKVGGKHFW